MNGTRVARLGDHAALISSGSTPLGGSQVYLKNGPVLFIRSQNVLMNRLDLDDAAFIAEHTHAKMGRTHVCEGDVLLNITGASIGRVAVFDHPHQRANVNQHVCIIRPRPGSIHPTFLSKFISSPECQAKIQSMQNGETRQALTFSQIANFQIPLPPLSEQRRIAAILDQADALRVKRREAVTKLDALAQAVFRETFDHIDDLSNLERIELEAACLRITDGTHQPPEWADSGIPFLFVSSIVNGVINYETHKFISDATYAQLTRRCPIALNDILYTTVGSYGNAALVRSERKFAFQRHIAHLKPKYDQFEPAFFLAMLQSPFVRRQADKAARGVAQKTINLFDLKRFVIFKPSITEQRRFVCKLERINHIRNIAQQSLAKLDALFASLQHRAFRGEL